MARIEQGVSGSLIREIFLVTHCFNLWSPFCCLLIKWPNIWINSKFWDLGEDLNWRCIPLELVVYALDVFHLRISSFWKCLELDSGAWKLSLVPCILVSVKWDSDQIVFNCLLTNTCLEWDWKINEDGETHFCTVWPTCVTCYQSLKQISSLRSFSLLVSLLISFVHSNWLYLESRTHNHVHNYCNSFSNVTKLFSHKEMAFCWERNIYRYFKSIQFSKPIFKYYKDLEKSCDKHLTRDQVKRWSFKLQ